MSTSSTPLPCLLKHKICLEDCFPECEAPKDCNECVQPDPCSEEFPCCDGFFCCFSIGRGRYSYMQSTGRHRGRRVLRYHVLRDDAHAVSNVTLDPDRPGRCCFLDNECGGVVTDPAINRWGWTSGPYAIANYTVDDPLELDISCGAAAVGLCTSAVAPQSLMCTLTTTGTPPSPWASSLSNKGSIRLSNRQSSCPARKALPTARTFGSWRTCAAGMTDAAA